MDLFANGFTTISAENAVLSSGIMVGMKIGFSPSRIIRKARESGREGSVASAGRDPR
jgi:hypothetical protein